MWRSRILHDGVDRGDWELRRQGFIGASDAKNFARPESIPKYFRAKLSARTFHGNAFTERGHEFEPLLIAATGVPGNIATIHAPDEVGFAATPDGITPDGSRLAEAKLRHNIVAAGPSAGEWRQLAFQFFCLPEASDIEFVEGEVIETAGVWQLRRPPQVMTIHRGDPRITKATALIVPIAHEVLALVRAHRELEKEFA